MLTELGGSQGEVQRCSLSSDGPRLRSGGAQCAQTLAVEVQQCPLRAEVGEELGKAEVNMGVDAKVVEEKLEEREEEEKEVEDEEEEETEEENNCDKI